MSNSVSKGKAELDNETIYLKYLSMGDGRTISQLSAITGKSENALYKLQSRYNWKERIDRDSNALSKTLTIAEIGGMESSELLAATNRATIEKLAMYVQTAQPSSIRDAQILVSIHQLIKPERESLRPEQDEDPKISIRYVFDFMEGFLSAEHYKQFLAEFGEIGSGGVLE